MICVERLRWKQFREGMLLLEAYFFFKLHLDTSYSYIPARNEPQQLFAIYWSPQWSNEEGGSREVFSSLEGSSFSFFPDFLQGCVESF